MMDSATGQKGQKMQILKEKIVRYETDGSIVKGYDAGELIRCKDCKHRMHDKTCIKNMKRKPDYGYCDEGERNEW